MKFIIQNLFPFRVKAVEVPVLPEELEKPSSKAALLSKAESVRHHLVENFEGITVNIGGERGRHQLAVRGLVNANIDLIFQIKTADIGHVDVELAMREQGCCRRFTQNLHNAIQAIGFEKMSLKAVREGRVAWAALGFRPTPTAWKLRKSSFANGFRSVRDRYPADIADLIDRMILENDFDAFPVLANVNYSGNNRNEYRMMSASVMSNLTDWEGEFLVGEGEYTQYLFR
ncbi:hypothetical protein [Agrobacterium sp. NPDC089420]|uniref:hypothetical protein n=1 Tax=Agrobacterium sp. NPDC089420 TaxID=3363918 RepID=UPI0038503EC5